MNLCEINIFLFLKGEKNKKLLKLNAIYVLCRCDVCCYYLLLLNISITQNRWLSLLFRFTQINTKWCLCVCACVNDIHGSLQFISFLYLLMLTCVTDIYSFFYFLLLWDCITFTYLNYYGLLTALASLVRKKIII